MLTRRSGPSLFNQIERTLDRAFQDPFESAFNSPFFRSSIPQLSSVWRPICDFKETENAYMIEAELPGVKKDQVQLEFVDSNTLQLKGSTEKKEESEGTSYWTQERSWASFSRTFTFPSQVQQEKVEASFRDGVLHVSVPKKEPSVSRIAIQD